MNPNFSPIKEDFLDDLSALRTVVSAFSPPTSATGKARVAAVNSVTLLLAAHFEEFVRQTARAFAKAIVTSTLRFDDLPVKMQGIAWKRTLEAIARLEVSKPQLLGLSREALLAEALSRFSTISAFYGGDLHQDVYDSLIHNENNMRSGEINGLFKVSGENNICGQVCDKAALQTPLNETEPGRAHTELQARLEEFFHRRNKIAHSIGAMQSTTAAAVLRDIDLFEGFAVAMCETLEAIAPP